MQAAGCRCGQGRQRCAWDVWISDVGGRLMLRAANAGMGSKCGLGTRRRRHARDFGKRGMKGQGRGHAQLGFYVELCKERPR